jgi:hypothetical protein
MSWNRDSHQIVVLIGDQPPHGFIGDRDYPDGCPCGKDTLRVAHTMQKNGIVIYPVDCSNRRCPNRQTFYHALARITGGYALDLSQSELLPKIVFGACMEEKLMDKLAEAVAPVYEVCLKSHKSGRFEQHCRSVYAELNAKGFKVESCLPPDNYDQTIEHQVDCLAYCTDIKHAKAMCENEYFVCIDRRTKLCSYMERPVTQEQITKCMKRMKDAMAKNNFLKNGCQYRSAARFGQAAFKQRWTAFKQRRGIKNFLPWNNLTPDKIRKYKLIPDGEAIRKDIQRRGGRLSKGENVVLIGREMVGKEIQVEIEKKWVTVKVDSLKRGGKVRCILPDGFDVVIPETTKFKQVKKAGVWGQKEKPTPKPIAVPAPVPTVSAPTSAPVPAPTAPVCVNKSAQPAPAIVEQIAPQNMTKNVSYEVPEIVANRAVNQLAVENPQPRVNMRRNSAQSDSGRSISRSVDRSPTTVSTMTHNFVLGQIVLCKSSENGDVHRGIVINLDPLVLRVDGFTDGRWQFVRAKDPCTEAVLINDECVYSRPALDSPSTISKVHSGSKVHILEVVGDFAHVVSPFDGWVPVKGVSMNQVKEELVSQPEPMLPAIHCLVPTSLSAKDLATLCDFSGAVPKKVSIKLIDNRRVGVISFEQQSDAQMVFNRGLYYGSGPLKIRWCPDYLAENAI